MLYLICSRFVNGGYYFYFIGDRMDDFGQFITPENVDEYIARQTELWLALKDEYERTGTVTLMEE